MKLTVNGEEIEITAMSVEEYLRTLAFDEKALAVELNRDIVPKKAYASTILKEGDQMEIVWFVGGGQRGGGSDDI
ncbi:sulfur carrier protein ThiS [Geomonas sp. RF6]|uniref:sulfur carrier protein ThiS n=1 Tax=Geomonas sp. RF6 TaxID=2897342 RepID=UPI001E2D4202|nr:sulfur carrier protein ThiS [Geomonas sp. RF6]UFS70677.1 sulfur carrier protein ThiS [Geomonas sp. RF6]